MSEPTDTYQRYEDDRAQYSQKLLDSTSSKKIVMAGPGTGKSYLFQQVASKFKKDGKDNILVLSFINELVKDLTIGMHGLADVYTLHSFSAKQLGSHQTICMDLLTVVSNDLKIEKNASKNLVSILHNMDTGESDAIGYLAARRAYYAAYDPASIVYELVKLYTNDSTKIPEYDLILVDEYQDFNLLECELINLLATKNDILIAGDDDQSLYSFKHARPDNIRDKHLSEEYESFELPYCSRSTEVVINAFHDFLDKAKSEEHLYDRIDKQYLYFPCAKKDAVSAAHSKIEVRKSVFHTKNAYLIDQAIGNIFKDEPEFDVLIICSLKKQIKPLAKALRKKGYVNVTGDENESDKQKWLVSGLNLLVKDKDSNLAWRLCVEALADDDVIKCAVLASKDCDVKFYTYIPAALRSEIRNLRAIAVKLEKNEALSTTQRELIFNKLEVVPGELGEKDARERIFVGRSNNVHHSTKIKITTILGSKGLSYDYVFMVNFDDRYLIPTSGISDESINMFLVALTRSRKKISIYTSQSTEPTFVGWINNSRKIQM